ncbi:hypothetical protein ACFO0N_14040 [Halobium salinum]|uniref:DUF7988 domain-containing protein n=1 Tax=Halobium salinum TaxID=1364940 RepID=A0ABD5PDS4_9EURY|nr:hypothetical protein [Halobium salinum]
MNDRASSSGVDTADLAATVETRVRAEHGALLNAVGDCADAVATTWPEGESSGGAEDDDEPARATTDRDRVVPPFEALLAEHGLLDACTAVLVDAVAAAGEELSASPVAAPPYVVVTSVGPVLRATLPLGRLVLTLRVFDVVRDGSERPRYVRLDGGEPAALDVAVR